jgi:hypothetical protein
MRRDGVSRINPFVAVLYSSNQPVDGRVEYFRFVVVHGHVRHGQAQRDVYQDVACVNGFLLGKAVPLEHSDQARHVGDHDVAVLDCHQTRQIGPLHERGAKSLTPAAHTVLPTGVCREVQLDRSERPRHDASDQLLTITDLLVERFGGASQARGEASGREPGGTIGGESPERLVIDGVRAQQGLGHRVSLRPMSTPVVSGCQPTSRLTAARNLGFGQSARWYVVHGHIGRGKGVGCSGNGCRARVSKAGAPATNWPAVCERSRGRRSVSSRIGASTITFLLGQSVPDMFGKQCYCNA